MPTIGLFEAKQGLSEFVERTREGEKIGITRRGTLAAVLIPAAPLPEKQIETAREPPRAHETAARCEAILCLKGCTKISQNGV